MTVFTCVITLVFRWNTTELRSVSLCSVCVENWWVIGWRSSMLLCMGIGQTRLCYGNGIVGVPLGLSNAVPASSVNDQLVNHSFWSFVVCDDNVGWLYTKSCILVGNPFILWYLIIVYSWTEIHMRMTPSLWLLISRTQGYCFTI